MGPMVPEMHVPDTKIRGPVTHEVFPMQGVTGLALDFLNLLQR